MSKSVSIKVPMFHANEDGTTCTKEVKVQISNTGQFFTQFPDYLHKLQGFGAQPAFYTTLDSLKSLYEDYADRYSRWKLSLNGEKLLMLGVILSAGDVYRDIFSVDSAIALGLREVVRLGDGTVNSRDGVPLPLQGSVPPILLPDTPEVRAKMSTLIESIGTAAALIADIRQADSPDAAAQYLLAIGDNWTRPEPEPVQTELPLEAPATAVVEDDDEL